MESHTLITEFIVSSLQNVTASMSPNDTITETTTVSDAVATSIVPFQAPRRQLTLDDILGEYWEYHVSRDIGIYGYPVIVFLGTIGNMLTLLITIKPSMRKTSTCFYMAVLAIFDTLVLYFAGLRQWLALLQGSDALTLSPTACKAFNFLTYACFDIAVWILVAMTIERFIAVHFPFKAPKVATIPRARKVVCLLILLFSVINLHFFWTVTIDERGHCNYLEQFAYFHDEVWPWLDATIYSFLPFLLLLVFNMFIIYDSRKAVVIRRSTLQSRRMKNRNSNTDFQFRLSAMLVTVSVVFLLLSAPNVVLISIRHRFFDFSVQVNDFRDVAIYRLVAISTNLCLYLNHAVNFLLYCISGQRFRRELYYLVTCKWTVQQIRTATFSDALTRSQRLSESSVTTSPSTYIRETEQYI